MALKKLDNTNPADSEEINRLFGQAPEWVNFIGFDSDGYQGWYEGKPKRMSDGNYIATDEWDYNYQPFDGLHFENQTYANCCIERPRVDFGYKQFNADFWTRFKTWRQEQKNRAAKEAAEEVKRLINWGK